MTPWPTPSDAALPGRGPEVRLHDTATGGLAVAAAGERATMYVCGITPYDAAHVGHAATYVAFDLLHRAWTDGGHRVVYVQNVTDVDDPLLERAGATGEDWRDLAGRQTQLFADSMTALAVRPPDAFPGVSENVGIVAEAVRGLLDRGAGYVLDGPHPDVYADLSADPHVGSVSHLDAAAMAALFAERGGDPDRPGKRGRLDPLLWRAARLGEPAWDVPGLPSGRPGWHVECVALSRALLGERFDVQGGGADLAFPHHEMGASHARMLAGDPGAFARVYAHAGLVALDGEKMSKSRGNLVFVHEVLAGGLEPAALRLALLAHHYRSEWEWTDGVVRAARERVALWREAVQRQYGPPPERMLAGVRGALARDLDAPAALAAVDEWCHAQLADGGDDIAGPGVTSRTADTLLGVRL